MNNIEKILNYSRNIYYKRARKILILLYHRIINTSMDPRNLCTSPKCFENEIIYLKKNFNIIKTSDLIGFFKKEKVPQNSIVLTIDDGYYDSYNNAVRILKKHKIPSTFFIVSGMLDSSREFWWDELEKIFLVDFNNFKPLEIYVDNNKYFWEVKNKQDAIKIYNEIFELLYFMDNNRRNIMLDGLFNWSNKKKICRDSHRAVTYKELQELSRSNLFDIGSHTVNHCSLSCLSFDKQFYELYESKKMLENIIDKEVLGVAYPYGKNININRDSKRIAKKAGYKFGMTVNNSIFIKSSDLFLLPRYSIKCNNINDFKIKIRSAIRPDDIFDKIKEVSRRTHI